MTWQTSPDYPPIPFTATFAPAIELTPKPGKQSFHLRSTEQEVLRQVLVAYGIRMVDDGSLATKTIRFDADDVDFAQAAHLLSLTTDSFMVPLDPVRVMVAKESKENHEKYDRLSLETLRLPGLTAAEFSDMGNLAKNVLGIQQAVVDQGSGTLTVRAPASSLVALNQTLADLLDGKSEVLLDVKIYEVENTRTRLVGVQLPQTTTVFNVPSELNSVIARNSSLVQQIISSGLASAGDYAAIAAILIASGEVTSSILSQPFATFGERPYLDRPRPRRHYGKPEPECGGYAFARSGPAPPRRQRRRNDPQRHPISDYHLQLFEHCLHGCKYPGNHHRRTLQRFERVGN